MMESHPASRRHRRRTGATMLAVGLLVALAGCATGHLGAVGGGTEASAVGSATPSAVVQTRQETQTSPIPFERTEVSDPNRDAGTRSITTAGVDGVLTTTYSVTTVDGVETSRTKISEVVTTPPVSEVTSVGTRVAAPPPPPPAAATGGSGCDPNYADGCVPIASDVDCAGGGGNGPAYFSGTARVVGRDIYGLDRDGDGIACE